MFLIDARDTLVFAKEQASRLRDEAAADRTRHSRRSLVHWLRRHACHCRVDAAPLAHRPT
jgi:hypothetical protein